MKAFLDNYIPTLVFFILKYAMQKILCYSSFFLPTLYIAVVLLPFLENMCRRICIMQYKDVIFTVFYNLWMKVFSIRLSTQSAS